jgi:hypothetical protein
MAKTSKNGAAKSAVGKAKKKAPKKNKLTVDLGNLELTDKERLKLLDALYKTVNTKLKSKAPEPIVVAVPAKAVRGLAAAGGATVNVKITGANPGLSEIIATHKSVEKRLDQSDNIDFENVQHCETIRIQGKSLGKSEFSIDRKAEPQQQKFEPGTFRFHFFILQ